MAKMDWDRPVHRSADKTTVVDRSGAKDRRKIRQAQKKAAIKASNEKRDQPRPVFQKWDPTAIPTEVKIVRKGELLT